jgi:ubiquinone/menaquinone biosynthesis C-methylase UbiE
MGRTVEHFTAKGHNVVGIDIAGEGLKIYRGRRPEAKLVCASATDLPFRANSFDVVMLMGVLYEIEDLQKIKGMLNSMEKLLSDDGRLIYVCQYAKDLWKTVLSRVPFEKRWFRKVFMRTRMDQKADFKKWVFSNRETIEIFAQSGWRLERYKPVNQYYGAANWVFDAFHKRKDIPLAFAVELEPRQYIAFPGRLVARFSRIFAPMLSAGLVYFQFTRDR